MREKTRCFEFLSEFWDFPRHLWKFSPSVSVSSCIWWLCMSQFPMDSLECMSVWEIPSLAPFGMLKVATQHCLRTGGERLDLIMEACWASREQTFTLTSPLRWRRSHTLPPSLCLSLPFTFFFSSCFLSSFQAILPLKLLLLLSSYTFFFLFHWPPFYLSLSHSLSFIICSYTFFCCLLYHGQST